jgi:hypothetical protein
MGLAMNKLVLAVVSLLLLTFCQNASAQCPNCRAMSPFGNCAETVLNDPPEGSIAFTGTVIAAKDLQCSQQVRVEVTRSSAPSLPATIDIELGPCTLGTGPVGTTITGLVSAKPGSTGTYSAKPDYLCWKDGHPR